MYAGSSRVLPTLIMTSRFESFINFNVYSNKTEKRNISFYNIYMSTVKFLTHIIFIKYICLHVFTRLL